MTPKERAKKWYWDNRERALTRVKQRKIDNPEKVKLEEKRAYKNRRPIGLIQRALYYNKNFEFLGESNIVNISRRSSNGAK